MARPRHHLLLSLGCLFGLLLAPLASAQAAPPVQTSQDASYIVIFGSGRSVSSPRRALTEARRRSLDRVSDRAIARLRIAPTLRYRYAVHGFAAHLTAGQVRALARDPDVRSISPDRPLAVSDTPAADAADPAAPGVDSTDGGFIKLVTLKHQVIPSGVRRVRSDDSSVARIDGTDDARVKVDVATLDTGIDPNPDLDVRGGHDCLSPYPDAIRDREGHGTHVAGIIGAIDNDIGVVGVAPGARLWAVRVADDNGNALTSWYLCGVDWVMSQRDPDDSSKPLIKVVNMSVSGLLPGRDDRDCGVHAGDPLHQAICASVADGTTYVVAAGNQSTNADSRLPAAYDEVITVSALADYDGKPGGLAKQKDHCPWYSSDADDTYGDFSNYGPDVDLIAPGKCILSTMPHGQWGYMTGTSMATPHVTGAAALYIAAHPGVRPGQVRAALRHVATMAWKTSTDPDGTPDPLLDVHAFDDPPDFSVGSPDGSLRIGRGGRLEVPISVGHRNGHVRGVTLSTADVPDGIEASLRSGSDGQQVLVLRAADDIDPGSDSVTISGTDGELTHTTSIGFRVVGGARIDFSAPTGGPMVVGSDDAVPVAFTQSGGSADDDPPTRWVQRQRAVPVVPGSCASVAWQDQGDPQHPDALDDGGSDTLSWAFDVTDLPKDGCYRWVVSLVNGADVPAAWMSGAALLDSTPPRRPTVRATGAHAWQDGTNGPVWVRSGSGTLELTATDRDAGAGSVSMRLGEPSRPTGWTVDTGDAPMEDGTSSSDLHWSPSASGTTSVPVSTTDAMGFHGSARDVSISVDARSPSAARWSEPGAFRTDFQAPELRWSPGTDSGSGWAAAQRIQQQRAKVRTTGSCAGLTWANDGPVRMLSRPAQAEGLRSGYCYRWRITPVDRVGNRGSSRTSSAILFDARPPTGTFTRATSGTKRTVTSSTYRLTWSEHESGGSGGLTHALERERKTRGSDGSCGGRLWRLDGPTRTVNSGYVATDLQAGYCYRWRLILEDRAGNITTIISGIVARKP